MPYNLFWHLNPTKLEPFKIAYQKRLEMDDCYAWKQGMYIRSAIGSAMDKKYKYPEAPIFEAAKNSGGEVSAEERFLARIEVFNARFEERQRTPISS